VSARLKAIEQGCGPVETHAKAVVVTLRALGREWEAFAIERLLHERTTLREAAEHAMGLLEIDGTGYAARADFETEGDAMVYLLRDNARIRRDAAARIRTALAVEVAL
jgi:hypothetical protein